MAKNKADAASVIIVRRGKKHDHGHHGGSWKVAFADFMTAMMAFFLLLYLLEAASPKELVAIAGYFQDPGFKYNVGPGGADAAVLDLKSPLEESTLVEIGQEVPQLPAGILGDRADAFAEEQELSEEDFRAEHVAEIYQRIERAQLEALEDQLQAEIANASSALHQLSEQIRLEFTELGLSIQIVDKERRPMFAGGSARLQSYAEDALHALAPIIEKVPNSISIVGHTDATTYSAGSPYSNWELSTDRANSARRALLAGAYPEAKVIAVQGMGARLPLLPEQPQDPTNRRIAIIVLKKAVAEAMLKINPANTENFAPPAGPRTPGAPAKFMSEAEIEAAIEAEYRAKSKPATAPAKP